MTALDPGPIVAELREQKLALGQYDPATVERLIAATERTAETPVFPASALPFPRGGRASYPPARCPIDPEAFGQGARPTTVTRIGTLCEALEQRDRGTGVVRCSEPVGHADGPNPSDHVARGNEGRELARWSARPRPDCRTPALPSTGRQGAHEWQAGGRTR